MITIKLEGFEEMLQAVSADVVKQATSAALNRVTPSARTKASELIRNYWNVKKSDLDPRMKVYRAQRNNLIGIIEVTGRPMSLSYFGAKEIRNRTILTRKGRDLKRRGVRKGMTGPLPSGVQVELVRGRSVLLRGAFMAKMKSGHIGVFRRPSGAGRSIDEKNLITVASMVKHPRVQQPLQKHIAERWATEFPGALAEFQRRAGR